jgi:hypothetical protein
MSDKVGPNKGPVPMHKALAAGESLAEAQAAALGRSSDSKTPSVPAKNAK